MVDTVIHSTDNENRWIGFLISASIHAIIFFAAITIITHNPEPSGGGGSYVEISTGDGGSGLTESFEKAKEESKKPVYEEETIPVEDKTIIDKTTDDKTTTEKTSETIDPGTSKENTSPIKETKVSGNSGTSGNNQNSSGSNQNSSGTGRYMPFSQGAGDTSGLNQVYTEKSLNVRISYPSGWRFIDQNKRSKLDGVTFWADNGVFNPPPYVFLEVKEKYLFNPSRFKNSTKLRDAVVHYNDPVELEGQVSQIFYFRTEDDKDFSIKLIMDGKEAFLTFQPVFFGMIKTFRFGNSIF